MQVRRERSPSVVRRLSRRHRIVIAAGGVLFVVSGAFLVGAYTHEAGYLTRPYHALRSAPRYLAERAHTLLHPPEVPTIYVDMKFKQVRQIEEKRAEALAMGVLLATNADWVPATVRVRDQPIRVRMRLKGDWPDQFKGSKWSYRVKVRGDEAIWGMRVFSLQHPRTRNWDGEWLFHRHLKHEGVLGLRYFFARLVFNGEDKGIYAVEEHFSKELLESQERRESVIVKLDEAHLWQDRARTGTRPGMLPGSGVSDHGYTSARAAVLRPSKTGRSPVLSADRDAALQLLQSFAAGELPASRVFKVPELARFLAIAELYSAWHTLVWHNLRFHYDPLEGMLVPVGFDADADPQLNAELEALKSPWSRRTLTDPVVARAYVEELTRVSRSAYLQELRSALAGDWAEQAMAILHVEWPGYASTIWEDLARRQRFIRAALQPANVALAQAFPAEASTGQGVAGDVNIRIGSAVRLPVELLGFRVGDGELIPAKSDEPSPVILAGKEGKQPIQYSSFRIAAPQDRRAAIRAVCRLIGTTDTRLVPVQYFAFRMPAQGPRPQAPALTELLELHPFIRQTDEPDVVRIEPGDWQVNGDLIVPDGVSVAMSEDTTLRFAPKTLFLCSGRLDFRGTADAPVRLLPSEGEWAGLLVLNAPPSVWEYVEMRGTAGIDRNGWRTTGGVTFYGSPIRFVGCRFLDTGAEDAVNVVSAHFECQDCEFGPCRSDAFDGDFVTGSFVTCGFHDVGGDGVDISGSQVEISEVAIRRAGDKGISVGEDSELTASSVLIDGAKMGMVSKDLSHVEVDDLTVKNASIGLAAYVKKLEYGTASIEATDVTFESVRTETLVQTGSRALVNGRDVPEQEVDVEALYAADEPSQ